MFHKNKIIYLFLIFIFIIFSSCLKVKNDKQIKIRIAFWGSVEEVKIIKDTFKDWDKTHPDIEIIFEHTPRNYESKILTQAASGTAPDVIFTEVSSFVPLYYRNLFLPLNEFIENDKDFSIDDFFPEVVDRFTKNKKIYCIPRDTAPFACIFYNKTIFDKAGVAYPSDNWTLDDFLETARKVTKLNKQGEVIHYGYYGWTWLNFIYSFGGRIVDNVKNPKRCVMNSKQAMKGLQYYIDLSRKHKVMPSTVAIKNIDLSPYEMFMTGRIAMYGSGIWETPSFRNISDFDWDVALFPKGPKGMRAFGTGGSGYCIYSKTKHPKAAWEVVKCLAGTEGQIMLAQSGLAQPANRKIAQSKYFAKDNKGKPLNKKMLNRAVKFSIYAPFHPKWLEARLKYIDPILDKVFIGDLSVKEYVTQYVPEINKVMFSKE